MMNRDSWAPPRPTESRLRVLILDNDPTIVAVIRRVLGQECDMTSFTDPRDGCELIRNGARFDVILCDLLMPDLGGAEVYACIRRTAWEQADRIVFVTGATCLPTAAEFLASLPNPKLEKPFTRDALRDLVRRVGRSALRSGR